MAAAALRPHQHLAVTGARTHQRIEGPGKVSRMYSRASGLVVRVGGVRSTPLRVQACGCGPTTRGGAGNAASQHHMQIYVRHTIALAHMAMRAHGDAKKHARRSTAHLPMLSTILLKLVTQVSE